MNQTVGGRAVYVTPTRIPTVWLISIAHVSVGILILHHYRSDLSYLSYFDSLVIAILKSEICAKKIKKRRTCSEPMKFAQFWVVSVRKYIIKMIYYMTGSVFWNGFFFAFLFIYYLVKKESVILRSLSCFNHYFLL